MPESPEIKEEVAEKPKKRYKYTKKTGRPTSYKPKLGKEICIRIAGGESVCSITKDEKMPSAATVFNWLLDEDKKEFLEQYKTARNIQAELMFEELLDIADDGTNDFKEVVNARAGSIDDEDCEESTTTRLNAENIQRSRLRVDTRKWYLSKVLPKKFGEKLELGGETKVAFTGFEKLEEKQLDAVIKQLQGRIGESSTREGE